MPVSVLNAPGGVVDLSAHAESPALLSWVGRNGINPAVITYEPVLYFDQPEDSDHLPRLVFCEAVLNPDGSPVHAGSRVLTNGWQEREVAIPLPPPDVLAMDAEQYAAHVAAETTA